MSLAAADIQHECSRCRADAEPLLLSVVALQHRGNAMCDMSTANVIFMCIAKVWQLKQLF